MTSNKECFTLAEESLHSGPKSLYEALLPLLKEAPVVLGVDDSSLPKKTRGYKVFLSIVPMPMLGITERALLVALPPYGAEYVKVPDGLKANTFVRIGLRFFLAKALADTLNRVYGEHHEPA